MINENFIFLGLIIGFIGSTSYMIDTLKGKTSPNRVTWFLWALAPLIAFAAQLSEDVGIQSLLTFAVGFGPLLIFLASFVNRKSVWHITRFDIVCGVLSLIGLAAWFITRHGNAAIFFSIVADCLAALPTVKKSWEDPESESSLIFALTVVSSGITLLTLDTFTFANSAFGIYIFTLCALLFALIQFKLGPRFRKRS